MWSGCGEISGRYWGQLKRGAAARGVPFELSIEFAWQKFLDQARRCYLSGASISMNDTASLDRIDSSKSYAPGNVQWVHKSNNLMKNALPEDDFVSWCARVADHSTGRTTNS